jgi:acyl carrier protein
MNPEISDRLKHIIAEQLDAKIELHEIEDEKPLLQGGLGLDSVAVMGLITLIEENFGFEFADDELNLKPFQNLHTLTDFVAAKLQAKSATDTSTAGGSDA